jgi:hypothetical protein
MQILQRKVTHRDGVGVGGEVNVLEGEVRIGGKYFLQRNLNETGNFRSLEIDDMETDIAVARVIGVAMLIPAVGVDMDFKVSAYAALLFTHQQDRIEKVRAGLEVPVAGMFNFDHFCFGCFQPGGPITLVGPHALEVPFAVGEVPEASCCFFYGRGLIAATIVH